MTVMVMYNDVDQVGTSDIGDIDDRGVGNDDAKGDWVDRTKSHSSLCKWCVFVHLFGR